MPLMPVGTHGNWQNERLYGRADFRTRSGSASFDAKLDALAMLVKEITINRGKPSKSVVENLFNGGYDEANMIDIIIVIGDRIISNFIHGVTQFGIYFPRASELQGLDDGNDSNSYPVNLSKGVQRTGVVSRKITGSIS